MAGVVSSQRAEAPQVGAGWAPSADGEPGAGIGAEELARCPLICTSSQQAAMVWINRISQGLDQKADKENIFSQRRNRIVGKKSLRRSEISLGILGVLPSMEIPQHIYGV